MSHQVLARKWRPRTFKEMVGQEHVLQALMNALEKNRLHHAYLFTGTRGVGKTTIARILVKCLNCEQGITAEPCGTCSTCVEINEGRCVDLIEVDAASRTKVEDTRELLDNVQYAPTRARFKVYLIDEVHMLSTHSFNALLKTLEEPPPHVKFLLATTDPQKLPVTILSRCLQFNLKNMLPERIVKHLQHVLTEEGINYDESALWQLGRAADGSMRDALSLTDQAIGYGDHQVCEADVCAMLGTIDKSYAHHILEALIAEDGAAVLAQIAAASEMMPDYSALLEELIGLLHRIAVAQVVPDATNNSLGDREQVKRFAAEISREDIQLYYQIALIGRRDLPLNPDPRNGLEMVLLRMLAFKPSVSGSTSTATGSTASSTSSPAKKKQLKAPIPETANSSGSETNNFQSAGPDSPLPPIESYAETQGTVSAPVSAVAVEHAAQPHTQIQSQNQTQNRIQPQGQPQSAPQAGSLPQEKTRLDLVVNNSAPVYQVSEPTVAMIDAEQVAAEPVGGEDKSSDQNVDEDETNYQVTQALEALADSEGWIATVQKLNIRGMAKNILFHCAFKKREGSTVFLSISHEYIDLLNAKHRLSIEQSLADYFATSVLIDVIAETSTNETPTAYLKRQDKQRLDAAKASLQNDPVVQALINEFGATIDESSIEPLT